jgi:hypothetical protein
MLYPNCSESIFRFHTIEPDKIQEILQLLADEISTNTGFEPHKNQKIPLFKKAEDYDTDYQEDTTYNSELYKSYHSLSNKIMKLRDEKVITQEKAMDLWSNLENVWGNIQYPKNVLKCCAGLGDNETVIKVDKEKEFFTLNIGNNDISQNKTGWVEKIKDMNIQVEEAECDKDLSEIARDCTCGITYGFQDNPIQRDEE